MEVHLEGCPNAEGEEVPRRPSQLREPNTELNRNEPPTANTDSSSSQEEEPVRDTTSRPLLERREPEAHVANHEEGRGTNATPSTLPFGASAVQGEPEASESVNPSLTHGTARVKKDGNQMAGTNHGPTPPPLTHGNARVEEREIREKFPDIMAESDAASTHSLGVFSFFPRPPPSDASGLEPTVERMKDFDIPKRERDASISSTNARKAPSAHYGPQGGDGPTSSSLGASSVPDYSEMVHSYRRYQDTYYRPGTSLTATDFGDVVFIAGIPHSISGLLATGPTKPNVLAPRNHGPQAYDDWWIVDSGASDWFARESFADRKHKLFRTEVSKAGGAHDDHKLNRAGEVLVGPKDMQLMPVTMCCANKIISYIHVQGQPAPYIGYILPQEAEAILAILAPRYLTEPIHNNLPYWDPDRVHQARKISALMHCKAEGKDISSIAPIPKPTPRLREQPMPKIEPTGMLSHAWHPFQVGGMTGVVS